MKIRFGLSTESNHLIKCIIEFFPAVGISGRIFLDSTDEYLRCLENLPPTHRNRKDVCISEGNIRSWNYRPVQIGILDVHRHVGQTRSCYFSEMPDVDNEPLSHLIKLCNIVKRLHLPCLGALAIVYVQKSHFVVAAGDSRGNAAIHSTADQNNCE